MQNKKRIFIALTEQDLSYAVTVATKNDVIITDLAQQKSDCQYLTPAINNDEAYDLSLKVRKWFKHKIAQHRLPDELYGYINNFYECSVRPTLTFFRAIDTAIEKSEIEDVTFVLPFKINSANNLSSYYMAEFESIGVHLYDRNCVIAPYIEEYILTKGKDIEYVNSRSAFKQLIFNFIRIWGVLVGRFFKDINNNVIHRNENMFSEKEAEYKFILRTIGQSSTLLPFLERTTLRSDVIVADSNTDDGAFKLLTKRLKANPNVNVIKRKDITFTELVKTYLSVVSLICKKKEFDFEYSGVCFNFNQAVTETIVMLANLIVYKKQVLKTLSLTKNEHLKLLFSLEQKSPHAFVDTMIAQKLGVRAVQIKQCNQHFWPIPEPVFSHCFLVDFPELLDGFSSCWPDHREKLVYIGSFQGADGQTVNMINPLKRKMNKEYEICFFAGFHHRENIETLKCVYEIDSHLLDFNLTVKLHPRDNKDYSQMFPLAKFIQDQEESFADFCEIFDLAFTYPSSVVSELLFTDLPFFVYRPDNKDYRETSGASDFKGTKTIYEKDELINILLNIPRFYKEFSLIYNGYKQVSGIVTDIKAIDLNISDLSKKLFEDRSY